MKIPNYLMTSLAFVGAISLIIMACSADNSNSAANNNSANAIGKYQISGDASTGGFHVVDTETGIVKSYKFKWTNSANNSYEYVYNSTTVTQ
jgi:uncharacterized protein involved in high-affinity Fe2+ transport